PILRGNESWKCPGHGTVVHDSRGRDFLLYHAYKRDDFVYVGRQAMLDEVNWGAGAWPTINNGQGPSAEAASPFGARDRRAEYTFFDNFRSAKLEPGWQWPQSNEPQIRIERRGGRSELVLMSSNESQSKTQALSAIVARSTTTGNYVATTQIDTSAMQAGALAGLSAYGDGENALGASVSNGNLMLWRLEKGNNQVVAQVNASSGSSLFLRMTVRDGHLYRFAFSRNGRDWTNIGDELDGSYLPPWDRGVRIALAAGGTNSGAGRFDFLRIE
ncbi:MAG: xylosidase, partial [Acidobacteriota bacterium]|nr:xylosidase [Acidobacteriota bacterium]